MNLEYLNKNQLDRILNAIKHINRIADHVIQKYILFLNQN